MVFSEPLTGGTFESLIIRFGKMVWAGRIVRAHRLSPSRRGEARSGISSEILYPVGTG